MTSEKITVTLGELVNTFLDNNKPLPEFAVLIAGKEYKADNENIAVTDKEGTFKVFLLEEFKGKKVITADGSKVKVSYDPPKVVKQDTAKTDKADESKKSTKSNTDDFIALAESIMQVDPLTVDNNFFINHQIIDYLVARNESQLLGQIAKLQAEFLKLQKQVCDRLMADDKAENKADDKAEKNKPNSDRATEKPKTVKGLSFNEKLDLLKKAYLYIETAKKAGKKAGAALLEAKAKYYWANTEGQDMAIGKDKFNNYVNGYGFTRELFGNRTGDMHKYLIDRDFSLSSWEKYCTSAELKPQAEKAFFE